MTDLSAGIPLDDSAATLASSALLDGSACSALLHRDPSPDREAESVVLQYNRLPNYCRLSSASKVQKFRLSLLDVPIMYTALRVYAAEGRICCSGI